MNPLASTAALPPGFVRRRWCASALALAVALWLPRARAQTAEPVPVLVPDSGEPFRSVFARILDGIDAQLPQRSLRLSVPSRDDPELIAELRRRRPPLVIALGRAGMRAALALGGESRIVGGGVIGPTEADTRATVLFSLAPDPALLARKLRLLRPAAQRVHAVYSPAHSSWLMRLAAPALHAEGMQLRGYEAAELRAALKHYQDLLPGLGAQDAIWLPQDAATVDEAAVLPLLLRECWNRQIALFSSNLAHVRRGALFALFPDNFELGRQLGSVALAHLQHATHATRGVLPLREVRAALNMRTARHLGIDTGSKLQGQFDLLLPER